MKKAALIGLLSLFLASCVARPERLDSVLVSGFADSNVERVTAGQEPITQPITLYDAMARAIKYNLDFQVELYNELLESRQLNTANLEMLPQFIANSEFGGRNNKTGGTTAVLRSDRNRTASDIALSWNILDFGLSYVRAKQAADKVLIAEEQRRKIINRVIEDVRTAYWRAASADRLITGLQRLIVRVRRAIRDSEALQKDGVSSPLTALTYQRELVEIQQRIQSLQSDLVVSKAQLAALMNVTPGTNFRLASGNLKVGLTSLQMSADEMIFTAMQNRPEIRDVQYNMRINQKEAKVALLELLPSANLFVSGNLDTDSFLLNSNWIGWGAKATWNLMKVFKYPARKRLVVAKDEVLDKRALAITMAIMTQVHVSRVRYANTRKLYFSAAKHLRIQNGILRQIRVSAAADQASEQTLIREEMNTLVSRVKRDIAYADLQNSYANLYSAMGLDPYTTESISSDSLTTIAASLKRMWIERGVSSGALRISRKLNKKFKSGASSYGDNPSASRGTPVSKKTDVGKKQMVADNKKPVVIQSRFGNDAQFTGGESDKTIAVKAPGRRADPVKQLTKTKIKRVDVATQNIPAKPANRKRVIRFKIKKPIIMAPVAMKKPVRAETPSKSLAILRARAGN